MEKIKYIVNIEGCLIHNKKILMILRGANESHAPNTLAFPGGQVESTDSDDNTFEDTVTREIYEEVGLKTKGDFEYIESKKFVTKMGNTVIDIVMLCRLEELTDIKIDDNEVKDGMWMTVDQILNDIRTPVWIKKSVQLVKNKLNL